MTSEAEKGSDVSSSSTDLDMGQIERQRREIERSLAKLERLSKESKRLQEDLEKSSQSFRRVMDEMERQLKPSLRGIEKMRELASQLEPIELKAPGISIPTVKRHDQEDNVPEDEEKD